MCVGGGVCKYVGTHVYMCTYIVTTAVRERISFLRLACHLHVYVEL